MSNKIGKIIQIVALHISMEDEAQLIALDDNGNIWEQVYSTKKIKVGTYERDIRMAHNEDGKCFRRRDSWWKTITEDVIRRDNYTGWRQIIAQQGEWLRHKGIVSKLVEENKTFKPCEEEELS